MTKLVAFDLDGTLNMTHTCIRMWQPIRKPLRSRGRACCRERDTLQVQCSPLGMTACSPSG